MFSFLRLLANKYEFPIKINLRLIERLFVSYLFIFRRIAKIRIIQYGCDIYKRTISLHTATKLVMRHGAQPLLFKFNKH